MKIKDVPKHPAYLVWHDAYDNGAMDIFGYDSYPQAIADANERNFRLENEGHEEAGRWQAYEKLPRVRVYKYIPPKG